MRPSPSVFLVGFLAGTAVILSGCTAFGAAFDNTMCSIGASGVPLNLENAIDREVSRQGPNGMFGQTYSRENWDSYWNDRIYSLWDSEPDCGRMPAGITGREAVLAALARRDALGLPVIALESRNAGKELSL